MGLEQLSVVWTDFEQFHLQASHVPVIIKPTLQGFHDHIHELFYKGWVDHTKVEQATQS